MDKNSLMASLMGDGGGAEQDLFGDVPIDDDPPFAAPPAPVANGVPVGASIPPPQAPQEVLAAAPPSQPLETPQPLQPQEQPVPQTNGSVAPSPAAPPPQAPAPSLLSKSGLLGMADDTGGGGGLFDAVDEEEKQKEEAERLKREEEERQRREAEEAARLKQQQEEEERARRQQEEQQRQEQLRQQQLQQQQQQQQQYGQAPYGQQQQPMYQQQQPPQQQSQYGYNAQAPPMQQSHMQQQQPVYQQQQSAMMQSTVITTPSQQQQQQLNSQMNNMQLNPPMPGRQNQAGFYRDHQQNAPQQGQAGPPNAYGGAAGNNYYYGTQQPAPQQPQVQQPRQVNPNVTAGMHNPVSMGHVRKIVFQKPQDVPPLYTAIKITEPMLIQNSSFLLSSPPYWSYQVTTTLCNNQGTWLVRRRFRHVVALEDRLRQACPGSILPPRPDKHAARALEEASAQQSAEFAMQRAKELETYLNMLANHPVAGQSQPLRLFLGLQDDIGTAWAEVSSNAFTRLGAVGAEMSMKVAESTNLTAASAPVHEWEDNAELLALSSSESVRMGAVSQAVPKLEGAVTLMREQGDAAGAVGMELSKIGKSNVEDFKACEILSNAMLRNGRRTKRLALELSAALDSFLVQYKMVRYEKMAMQDRRQAIQRRGKERRGADSRAYALAQQQRQLQATGRFDQLQNLEQSAIYGDQHALSVGSEADEIGMRLKSEIHRVAISRRKDWNKSMKTVASSMKEAASEQRAIWEATLETLQQQLSDMSTIQDTSTIVA